MDDNLKRMIREQVAEGNLTEVLRACVAECHLQFDNASAEFAIGYIALGKGSEAEANEWQRQENFLDYTIAKIEGGDAF